MTAVTRAAVMTELPHAGAGEVFKITWSGLDGDDDGEPVDLRGFNDRSIQAIGTFDNATITIQGSNDGGTTWAGLRDPSSTALTFTAAGLKGVLEAVQTIRPLVSGGGGSTSLTVVMICARTKR